MATTPWARKRLPQPPPSPESPVAPVATTQAQHRLGYASAVLLVLAAAVLFGTTGTARALGPASASPLAVGAARLVVGALALGALAVAGGTARLMLRCWDPGVRTATAIGAVAIAGYQACFFTAVKLSGVALGTLIAIGAAPVLAGAFGLALGERPGRRWGAATLLAVAGCAVLLLPGHQVGVTALGVSLALGAAASYAAFTVASRRVLLHVGSADAVMTTLFGVSALLLLPVLAGQDLRWLASGRGLGMMGWLGLVATAGAYGLFSRALLRLPAATATTLDLAEPLTASVLGVAVVGERLAVQTLAGAALVAAGLVLLSLPQTARRD